MRKQPVTATEIRIAARQMASDDDICRMYGLSAAQLGRWRDLIDRTRTATVVSLKSERMRAQARTARRQESKT